MMCRLQRLHEGGETSDWWVNADQVVAIRPADGPVCWVKTVLDAGGETKVKGWAGDIAREPERLLRRMIRSH